MKTRSIARGFVGALSLAGVMGLVACGAEVGDGAAGDSAEIGSTAEALSVGSTVAAFSGTAVEWAATCPVTVGGVDKLVVYGGYNSAGNALDQAYLYTPGTPGSWAALDAITDTQTAMGANDTDYDNQERGEAKFVPLTSTTCLLVGGLSAKSGGAVRARTLKLDVSGSAHHQWSKTGDLTSGRAKFAAAKCGTGSNVAVFGGHTAAGTGTTVAAADSVEVWNGTNAWSSQNVLSPVVSSFGFAVKDSQKFVIAGGLQSGNNAEAKTQAFTATTGCTLTRLTNRDTLRDPANTANDLARFGAVALFKPGTDDVYITAGSDGSGTPTDVQKFAVSWTTAPTGTSFTSSLSGSGKDLPNAVRFPTLVSGFTSGKLLLIGGEDMSSSTALAAAPVNYVQELDLTGANPAWTSATLGSARLGSAAEYLSSASKAFVTTGMNAQGTPPTLLTSTEPVTP